MQLSITSINELPHADNTLFSRAKPIPYS